METLKLCPYDSPLGQLTLIAADSGLKAILWSGESVSDRVSFGDAEIVAATPSGTETQTPSGTETVDTVLAETAKQLDEYFNGKRHEFDLKLDPEGTDFQLSVWQALTGIAYGQTATYAQQAAAIGNSGAVRAVGAANGKNPLSIVVPCHRVVGADGSLTGFAGGLEAKAWLLDHETKHA